MDLKFVDADLIEQLERMPFEALDDLQFGVIVMDRDGFVLAYNAFESSRAGIDREKVLGRHFFESVGPCTNNYLVAQRFIDQPHLEEFLDYTFTLRMAPTPVRLRMLARTGSPRQYLAVIPK